MKVIGPKKAVKNIATIIMATTVVASSYSVILPAVKVSAADKKIEEIFEDKDLQKWVSKKVDKDKNGYLSQSEIDACTRIEDIGWDVCSLDGLEIFRNLEYLNCRDNRLKKIDISLPKLKTLNCYGNESLEILNLTKFPELEECIAAYHNSLQTIDVSHNPKLKYLFCVDCSLTSVVFGECNSSIEKLILNRDGLTSIDLSKLTGLTELSLRENGFTTIDLSKLTALTDLDLSENELSTLDISGNRNLEDLNINYNKFEEFDLNSESLKQLRCLSNKMRYMDLSGLPNLTHIYCSDNKLTKIDLSKNRSVEVLACENNFISELNCKNKFSYLDISDNLFTDVDGINKEKLRKFYCTNNKLTKIDVSMCSDLYELKCDDNQIKELKVNAEGLRKLTCSNNELADLDISKCPDIVYFNCKGNKITSLDLINNTQLKTIYGEGACEEKEDCLEYSYELSNLDIYKLEIPYIICDKGVKIFVTAQASTDNGGSTTSPSSGNGGSSNTQGTGSVDTSSVPSTGNFEDFVERLYVVALGRASEEEGKAHWCKVVGNGSYSGADCARFFLTSPEFNGRNLNDEEYLKVLYKTFFDRDAAEDPEGFNFWLGKIGEWGRARVLEGFIDSTEWCNICADYGVRSGAMTAKATKASKNATAFATRLYTECLGREPEESGLNYWSLSLTNQERTGTQAAKEFFYSPEFKDKNLGDEEYVNRLYKTFMGREPETDGKAHWLNQLSSGAMNRDQVFDFFSTCEEFTGICNSYAIAR